jgi:hypothetical protein
MSVPTHSGPTPVRGAMLLGVVFVVGALAGAALDRAWFVQHLEENGRRPGYLVVRERNPVTTGDSITDRLRAVGVPDQFLRLHLTSEQATRLAEIAKRRRPQADSVNAVVRRLQPTVQHMETEMMQEMLCAITPAQQADWLAYMQANGWEPRVVAERYRLVETHTCPANAP